MSGGNRELDYPLQNTTASNAPHVIAFVGHSGSGKTTLLLKVIPALAAHGIRAAVVKHSSHRGVATDIPGSDTRRLWDAGADTVALVTPDRMATTQRYSSEPSLGQVVELVTSALPGASTEIEATGEGAPDVSPNGPRESEGNIILVEGYKHSHVPKIEVVRSACDPHPLHDLTKRIACVTDVPGLELNCPILGLNDVDGVVGVLLRHIRGEP